jgi:salicylate hydroxylase
MESQQQTFSIAIIGSGIGGLALAIGLLKQNIRCTIYEAAPKFDAVGAGIGLGPNALRSMHMMDEKFAQMYDEVKVGNTSPAKVHEQFEILGAEEGLGVKSEWYGGSVSHPDFTRSSAHRKALLDIMESLIPDGVVQFNKRVQAIDQEPGKKVVIRFTDGQTSEVDAVIGCDGIKGMTRRVVLESRYPNEIPAVYANTYVYRGIAPMEDAKKILGSYAEDAKWYMMERRGWAMYPISKGTEVNMVAFMHDDKPWAGEQVARECSREEMESEFVEMDSRLKAMLEVIRFLFSRSSLVID